MNRKRSGLSIAKELILLVKQMLPIMCVAILLGVLGFVASIGISFLASSAVVALTNDMSSSITVFLTLMIVFGVLRGVLRYGEQACNHYIAFKLLADIRDRVYKKLRQLAPAKLDGKDKGDLIAMITSDVELLEVFYAHTISPIAIAIIVSLIMVIYLFTIHPALALFALLAYIIVGYLLPNITSAKGKTAGMEQRGVFSSLNSFVLEFLHGLPEVLQFKLGKDKMTVLDEKTIASEHAQKELKKTEGSSRALTDTTIMVCITLFIILISYFVSHDAVDKGAAFVAIITFASSFGPVTALSNLANNLIITFASGERVLDLLEEEPLIEDVVDGVNETIESISCKKIDFSYDGELILEGFSRNFKKGEIIGVKGKSGAGKSTLLKLLMRFYDTQDGDILYNEHNIKEWDSYALRERIAYFSQTTYLFQMSILENLKLAAPDASIDEIKDACRKANINDFIESLDQGYDTMVNDMAENFSGGERQRLGLARVFLQDADIVLLDEPTSNLDSLNEAMILTSIKENLQDKIVLLVSHRDSTLKITDRNIIVKATRNS